MATTKKKATKKKKPARKLAKPRARFEGRQRMIPGVAPKKKPKAGAASTYQPPPVAWDDKPAPVAMPAAPLEQKYRERRRARSTSGEPAFTHRLNMRIMPDQAIAWSRASANARLSLNQWIRQACDAAVAAGAK